MIRCLLLSSLLVCSILAQAGDKVVRIRPSGGWNTISDDFSMPLEDSRIAHNIDFSANIGGLTVRKGIEAVTTIPTTWDSLVSIYGAYYSDGSQQLFAVADSAGVGYGNIIFGAKGSSDLSAPTSAIGYWPIQNKTKFAMIDDRVFAINGQQRGMVWDGRTARRWPLPSPGEPVICPLKYDGVSSYKLNGEYKYIIKYDAVYDGGSVVSYSGAGVISPSVIVSNGRVLLSGLTFPSSDSIAISPDSAKYRVYRTKNGILPVDAADTAWQLPNIRLRSVGTSFATFYTNESDVSAGDYFIDSIPDNLLSNDSTLIYLVDGTKRGRSKIVGNPKFGFPSRTHGAPTYMSKIDSSIAAYVRDSTHKTGLMLGIPTGLSMAGWAYAVSCVDTVNLLESDTGRSLFVIDSFTSGTGTSVSKPFSLTIGLPRVSTTSPGVMKNIYRAPVWIVGHNEYILDTIYNAGGTPQDFIWRVISWRSKRLFDSVATSFYYRVATVPASDTIYTDDMRFDSLTKNPIYRRVPPPLFNNLFSFENRLYGTAGSNAYFSTIDTVSRWGAIDFISVGKDDGDFITTAFPSRGVIRVLKNRSNYNIFQGADLGWNRTEVSGYFGCIAPNSHAATINGHYYVSDIGVIRETEGANLERTQSIENVSAKLKQFADFSVETARKISAFAIPSEGKVLFSLPDGTSGVGTGDTTYVYDERTNTWASWGDVVFSDATLYGAETGANFVPGDTMYFIRPGERTVYRYGTGTAPVWQWESAPFGMENPNVKQVTSVGVWANNMMAEFGISAVLRNEQQVTVTSPAVNVGALTNGYQKFSFPLNSTTAIYHTLRLSFGSGAGALRAFDIYQTELGEREEQ